MNGYKLVSDHPDHVMVRHPDGSNFAVAKRGLTLPMMQTLAEMPKHLAEPDAPVGEDAPDTSDTPGAPDTGNYQEPANNVVPWLMGDSGMVDQDPPPNAGASGIPLNPQPAAGPAEPGSGEAALTPVAPAPAPPVPGAPYSGVPVANPPPNASPPAPSDSGPAGPPDPMVGLADPDKIAAAEKAANLEEAQAHKVSGDDQAKAWNDYNVKVQAANDAANTRLKTLDDQATTIQSNYANGKIDPSRLWNNASTGSKIGMMAGIIISGFGAGAGQGNMAMNVVNQAIDRDVEAQKTDMSKNENLFKMNRAQYGDTIAATDATRANLLAATKGAVDAAAAKEGSAVAMARAKAFNSQVDMQLYQLHLGMARYTAGMNMFGPGAPTPGGSEATGYNDQKLSVALSNTGQRGFPSKEEIPKLMEERGKYAELSNAVGSTQDRLNKIAAAYDSMPKDPGNALQAKLQIDALKAPLMEEMARKTGGRATPIDMEAMGKSISGFLSDPKTRAVQNNNIIDMVKEGYSFPYSTTRKVLSPNDPLLTPSYKRDAMVKKNFKK